MAKNILLLCIFVISFAHISRAQNFKDDESTESYDDEAFDLALTGEGSGTSWQPDSSPVPMIMADVFGWDFWFHGRVFGGLDWQDTDRGDLQVLSTNWFMVGIRGALGPGQLSTRFMFSLEPLTVPGRGYPLLFQSGQTYDGLRLHDRQHPHNLFLEAALRYQVPVGDDLALDFYLAPVGAPALGPTSSMNRVSARSNPFTPIGHNWYDSTHVSFGVVTLGIYANEWKFDASWFNGREPSENRYSFDLRVPDSFSGRITYNPISEISWQASYGYINCPQVLKPMMSIHRVTTSMSSGLDFWEGSNFASTLVFGMNLPTNGSATAFGLLEFDFELTRNHTLFGRAEGGTKTGETLGLLPSVDTAAFGMGAFSLGYSFNFPSLWKLVPSVGAVGTLNLAGEELGTYYGGPIQFGGMVFLKLGVGSGD